MVVYACSALQLSLARRDVCASVTEMPLMHDYLVGANFTTAPRLKEKFFAFAPDVLGLFYSPLLPWEFIYAKLRNLTISPTWLGDEICSSDVNMHKGHSLLMT